MSAETWLDVASSWVAGLSPSSAGKAPFTTEQTVILRKAFEESFPLFAEKIDVRLKSVENQLAIHSHGDDTACDQKRSCR